MSRKLHFNRAITRLCVGCAILVPILVTATLTNHRLGNASPVAISENVTFAKQWQNPKPQGNDLSDVSCSGNTCVAGGELGTVLTSGDGGATWDIPTLDPQISIRGVDCPTHRICVAVGNRVLLSSDGGTSWIVQSLPTPNIDALVDVSCPSPSTCYAITDNSVFASHNGGFSWSKKSLAPERRLTGISCPSDLICFITGQITERYTFDYIYVTSDGGDTWLAHQLDTVGAEDVSCADDNTCVIASSWGHIAVTKNGGKDWSYQASDWLYGVSCIKHTSYCMVVGIDGYVAVTKNGGDSWERQPTDATVDLRAVSCTSTTACVTVGDAGAILPTTDAGASWLQIYHTVTTRELHDISCAAAAHCIAVGSLGTVIGTSDAGGTWLLQESNSISFMNAVSCPSTTKCVAVGENGYEGRILTSNDGELAWTEQAIYAIEDISDVSCATPLNCAAIGHTSAQSNTLLLSTSGGQDWVTQTIADTRRLNRITCPTASDCFVAGNSGAILATHDGGTSWLTLETGTGVDVSDIECPTSTQCLASGYGELLRTVDGGNTWERLTEYGDLTEIDCPTEQVCFAGKYHSGTVVDIALTEDFGLTWTGPVPVSGISWWAIECTSPSYCFMVGSDGHVLGLTALSPRVYLPIVAKL